MSKFYIFLSFILASSFSSFVSANIDANIDADVDVITYYQDQNPFIEVNLHIIGTSLTPKKLDNALVESRANILITIEQNGEIVNFEKYGLISPAASVASDFIDLKRFPIIPGIYTVNIELKDQLNTENAMTIVKEISVKKWKDDIFCSKTDLLYEISPSDETNNSFFKYGYILLPAAYNFFHKKMDNLIVFKEYYSMGSIEENSVAAKIMILNRDSEEIENIVKYKKLQPSEKVILLESFDIRELVSGNYEIIIQLINRENEILLTDNIFFQRSNPDYDAEQIVDNNFDISSSFIGKLSDEEVKYNLKGLNPTLPQSEVNIINILFQEENVEGQRFYLYNYWNAFNPVNPEESFNQFWKIIKAVDIKFYSTIGRGFETDRGYIFLRYGKPNSVITVENEPSAPPYEIWFYDKLDLTGETNMKFLFYNPSLGGGNFELLHSTSRYERQNRQWEVVLYSKAQKDIEGNAIDATTVVDNVNRRAREYFEDNN